MFDQKFRQQTEVAADGGQVLCLRCCKMLGVTLRALADDGFEREPDQEARLVQLVQRVG